MRSTALKSSNIYHEWCWVNGSGVKHKGLLKVVWIFSCIHPNFEPKVKANRCTIISPDLQQLRFPPSRIVKVSREASASKLLWCFQSASPGRCQQSRRQVALLNCGDLLYEALFNIMCCCICKCKSGNTTVLEIRLQTDVYSQTDSSHIYIQCLMYLHFSIGVSGPKPKASKDMIMSPNNYKYLQ